MAFTVSRSGLAGRAHERRLAVARGLDRRRKVHVRGILSKSPRITLRDVTISGVTADPARGRPRDPRTQRSILDATRTLLATTGYDQISIDAIARAADVSRPTVYRRWPSKAHIVFDAVFGTADRGDVLTDTGDF